jgi:hypothetical protein
MEQRHQLIRFGVDGVQAIGFVQVARRTTKRQIFENRLTPTRLWHDMLDVKSCSLERLMHLAILAALSGTLLHCR